MGSWFGRAGEFPEDKPSVVLLMSSDNPSCAAAVAAGCEEEGIPMMWDVYAGSVAELSRRACLRSRLEVGIGIDGSSGAVALVKVTEGPYVSRAVNSPCDLRVLGQWAARMSKGEPLPGEEKPVHTAAAAAMPPAEEHGVPSDEVARISRMILEALRR